MRTVKEELKIIEKSYTEYRSKKMSIKLKHELLAMYTFEMSIACSDMQVERT